MKIRTTIIILFFVSYSFSQTTGLYGKKNYIEVNGLSNFRLFELMFDQRDYYKPMGNTVTRGRDLVDFGYRVTLGRVMTDNFALGIEAGMDYQSVGFESNFMDLSYTDPFGNTYYNSCVILHEMMDIHTFSVMPKLTFTKEGGLLPIGLNHEIGIGYTRTKIVDKDYNFKINSGSEYLSAEDSVKIDTHYADYNEKYGGMTFMYAFKIKTPISKKIMINYGLRYTLNLKSFSFKSSGSSQYVQSAADMARNIGKKRVLNFLTFNLGLSYAF